MMTDSLAAVRMAIARSVCATPTHQAEELLQARLQLHHLAHDLRHTAAGTRQ